VSAVGPEPECKRLHVKPVPKINIDELRKMSTATEATFDTFEYNVGFLIDIDRFGIVPRRDASKVPWTVLTMDDIHKLQEYNVIEEIAPAEVRGGIKVFTVREPAKDRRRAIKCPEDINSADLEVPPCDQATKAQIIGLVHNGQFAVQFDFAAFYDQFVQSDEVSALQCFKKGRKWYRQVTLPMGSRQAPAVAHSATRKIADFPGRECVNASIIDNHIIIGNDRDAVRRDGKRFVDRVAQVGGKLNEDVHTDGEIDELICSEIEWGGVKMSLIEKTVTLTDKVRNKLRASWANRMSWNHRGVAAHFGLLFWALGLSNVNPGSYFPALQYYAYMCRGFSECDMDSDYWDEPAVVWGTAMAALEEWTAAVLEGGPRRVPSPEECSKRDWIVCVDSCAIGWGYVAIDTVSGEIRTHGERWDQRFRLENRHRLHQSIFTEPAGVHRMACHLLRHTGQFQSVTVYTDSVTTMCSGNKGYSARSEAVNESIVNLRKVFPAEYFAFDFKHIAGIENVVADALSRGRKPTNQQLRGAAAFMRAAV